MDVNVPWRFSQFNLLQYVLYPWHYRCTNHTNLCQSQRALYHIQTKDNWTCCFNTNKMGLNNLYKEMKPHSRAIDFNVHESNHLHHNEVDVGLRFRFFSCCSDAVSCENSKARTERRPCFARWSVELPRCCNEERIDLRFVQLRVFDENLTSSVTKYVVERRRARNMTGKSSELPRLNCEIG